MKPLSSNDIESELSYAYLHAVASKAGASCNNVTRHQDNRGIDATLTAWGNSNNGEQWEIDLKVQLKATIKTPSEQNGFLSYSLQGIERYNDLRAETITAQRILVVLFLPDKPTDWMTCSTEELVLKKAAYWVCLRGAQSTSNASSQTVYLPKTQLLTPNELTLVFQRLAKGEMLIYKKP
jgi:hypothetical protein